MTSLPLQTYTIYVSVTLFSLCIGSFLNVVIYRLPQMLDQHWQQQARASLGLPALVKESFNLCIPRSHCPHCHHKLAWYDNIPLVSYLSLKGRCRYCLQKIAWQYCLVELATALLAIGLTWCYGLNIYSIAIFLVSSGLICLSLIDLYYQLLPDVLTLPLLWLGLLVNLDHRLTTTADAIIGAVIAYAGLRTIAEVYYVITKKQGLGLGDCKLLALFGAWLGWQALPSILFIAAALGLLVGLSKLLCGKHSFNEPLPFGPYIAIAGWSFLVGLVPPLSLFKFL